MRGQVALAIMMLAAGCMDHQQPAMAPSQEHAPSSEAAPAMTPSPTPAPRKNETTPQANQSAPEPPKPERIGSGHIVVGGPHSRMFLSLAVLGVPNVDGFFFKPPAAGTNVTTVTKDNRGLGYDLDFNFHDSSGTWLGGCATSAKDEVCVVPKGAARGEVVAHSGADLDIEVFTAPDKEATEPSKGL